MSYDIMCYTIYMITKEQQKEIAQLYLSKDITVTNIAIKFNVTPRSIQRLVKSLGINRTLEEQNKAMARLKSYYKKPDELKRTKRLYISLKLRCELLSANKACSLCGMTVEQGIRLEIDHKDENNRNNDINNLQVICNLCNKGKYEYLRQS